MILVLILVSSFNDIKKYAGINFLFTETRTFKSKLPTEVIPLSQSSTLIVYPTNGYFLIISM